MRTWRRLLVCALFGGCCAWAQEAALVAPAPKPAGWLLVLDKPYTGVQEYDREQKTAEGKTQTTHETDKFYRDSAGRLRKEVSREKERVVWTYLTDPAAKVQYRWNNEQKVVYVTKLGDPIAVRATTHPLEAGEVRDITQIVNGKRLKGTVNLLPAKEIEKFDTTATHLVLFSDADKKVVFSTTDRWYHRTTT